MTETTLDELTSLSRQLSDLLEDPQLGQASWHSGLGVVLREIQRLEIPRDLWDPGEREGQT